MKSAITAISLSIVAVLIALTILPHADASHVLESEFVAFPSTLSNLRGVAINEGAGKIYAVNTGYPSDSVIVLDSTTLEQIGDIAIDIPYPSDIAVDEISNLVYLTSECHCPEAATISIINGTSDQVIGSIDTQDYPAIKVAVNPYTDKIFAITNTTFMSIIDVGTGNVSKIRIDDKTIEDVANSGIGPYDLALTPIPSTAYVLDGDKKSILAIRNNGTENTILYNTTIDSVPDEHAVDNRLVSMAVNPDTNIIYVVNEAIYPPPAPNVGISIPTGYLSVINGSSGKVIAENITQVRSFFFDLTVDPKRNIVYALSGGGFMAINGSTNKVIEDHDYAIPESFYPRGIRVNPETNTLYLVAPTGILKISGPVSEEKELAENEKRQLLQRLNEANDMLGKIAQKIPYEELPVAIWSVDEDELTLAVSIDERKATLPKQAYVDKLQDLLGGDIPIDIYFGHVVFTTGQAPLAEIDNENGNQSLLEKIEKAHQLLTKMISNGTIREKGIPVVLSDADEQNLVLVVGIDDKEAVLPLEVYEERLKKILGEDIPMYVSFGRASLV